MLRSRPEARPALEGWLREHGTLEQAAASHPEAETRTGRGRVYVVPSPVDGSRWVVRHYHRGGAIASVLGDRYLRVGTPRPFQELETGWALEERGVPTPDHVGAAVYPSGIWYRGDLVTRYVPDSRDLAAVLFPGRSLGDGGAAEGNGGAAGADVAASAMRAAGRLLRTLHEAGVDHPDLNIKNILLADAPDGFAALVLDLDGASVRERVKEDRRRRMVARFWRSVRKWERRTGVTLASPLAAAFNAGYTG